MFPCRHSNNTWAICRKIDSVCSNVEAGHVARAYVICMLIAMTLSADFQTTCLATHNKYRQEEAVKFKVANLNELVGR